MTDVEKKVDMSLDELVAMRQKEAKKKVRPTLSIRPHSPVASTGEEAGQEGDGARRREDGQ